MDGLYRQAKKAFLDGTLVMANDGAGAVKVVLVDTTAYAVDLAAHGVLADIAPAAQVGVSPTLGALTTGVPEGGVFDADDAVLEAVSGPPVTAVVIFKDSGDPATSPLVAYIESFLVNGLPPPYVPNGGAIAITWSTGPDRIFKL